MGKNVGYHHTLGKSTAENWGSQGEEITGIHPQKAKVRQMRIVVCTSKWAPLTGCGFRSERVSFMMGYISPKPLWSYCDRSVSPSMTCVRGDLEQNSNSLAVFAVYHNLAQ